MNNDQRVGDQSGSSSARAWLNRIVLGIAFASLFSDWSHETATAILPAFLSSLGAAPVWLGIIEGVSDGLSSFAKLGSGFYTDGLSRRKPIACQFLPQDRDLLNIEFCSVLAGPRRIKW